MGEVLLFSESRRKVRVAAPRLLILSDRVITSKIVCDVNRYVTERMPDAPLVLLDELRSDKASLRCQVLNVPGALDPLEHLANSKNIRIVAVMCLMVQPPRDKIEALFSQAQIFFEDVAVLRGMMQYTHASR